MSFPVFLIGPILQVIAGVVRYAIDASKSSSDSSAPSSPQGQGPTVEFSPLLAELVGSQAYAGNLLPQGWLVPEGNPSATAAPAQAPLAESASSLIQGMGFQPSPLQEVSVKDLSQSTEFGASPAETPGGSPPQAPVSGAQPAPLGLATGLLDDSVKPAAFGGTTQADLEKLSRLETLPRSPVLSSLDHPLSGTNSLHQRAPIAGVPVPPDQPAIAQASGIEGGDVGGAGHGFSFAATRLHDDSLALDGVPRRFVSDAFDRPSQSLDALALPAAPGHLSGARENPPVIDVATTAPRELPNVTDQLVHAVRVNLESGRTEARLHLEPPDLGAVRVSMVMDHSALSLRFHAGSEATRSLLESSLHELRDQLAQQGISVGQMSVGLALDLAGRSGGQLPTPFRIRDERAQQPVSPRNHEPEVVTAPAISLSAIDLFA